jgi:hypothetical protein
MQRGNKSAFCGSEECNHPKEAVMKILLLFLSLAVIPLQSATFTATNNPTSEQTATFTPIHSLTVSTSPTISRTPSLATNTATITQSRTSTMSISPTVSQTPAPSTSTLTSTQTPTASLTPTPFAQWQETPDALLPTPIPTPRGTPSGSVIADFDNTGAFTEPGGVGQALPLACRKGGTYINTSWGVCKGLRGMGMQLQGTPVSGPVRVDFELLPGGRNAGGVDLMGLSSTRHFTVALAWGLAVSAGAPVKVKCIVTTRGAHPSEYAVELDLGDGAWKEYNIAFPGYGNENTLVYQGLGLEPVWEQEAEQGAMVSFELSGPLPADLRIDELRYAPMASSISLRQEADALGVSPEIVAQVRDLNLDPLLRLVIERMLFHCGCSVERVIEKRQTLSWGQVAAAYGLSWPQLVQEALLARDSNNLDLEPWTLEQALRSASAFPDTWNGTALGTIPSNQATPIASTRVCP